MSEALRLWRKYYLGNAWGETVRVIALSSVYQPILAVAGTVYQMFSSTTTRQHANPVRQVHPSKMTLAALILEVCRFGIAVEIVIVVVAIL